MTYKALSKRRVDEIRAQLETSALLPAHSEVRARADSEFELRREILGNVATVWGTRPDPESGPTCARRTRVTSARAGTFC